MELFDPNQSVPLCPICGRELDNIYLDLEGQPVYVDEINQCVSPYFITDHANFILVDLEEEIEGKEICAHMEIDHVHD